MPEEIILDEIEISPEIRIPHILKYMGSKREIIDFVVEAIGQVVPESNWVCDLFSGTAVVTASLKERFNVHSNDVQSYSSVLAKTYLSDFKRNIPITTLVQVKEDALNFIAKFKEQNPEIDFNYPQNIDLKEVQKLEKAQQDLINRPFSTGFHLFTKYYSGTYWNFQQCLWIDALRYVAEKHKDTTLYYAVISALISAMSYVSQSTGHYAQYRDVTSDNLEDILAYRRRDIWTYFERKFKDLITSLNGTATNLYRITNLDYLDCLQLIDEGSTVYADPPYQSVHYSRFYHALETLVKYDYPVVAHKGRYREDRHSSPFGKKTTVRDAFTNLFKGVKNKNANLALSYSNTGMISLEAITALAEDVFGPDYQITTIEKKHIHSTMGRADERQQEVTEYIILFKILQNRGLVDVGVPN